MNIQSMSNEEYHRAPAIGKSGLDLIAKSPAHFRYSAKREPTRAMSLGTATHMAIIEPDLYATQYVVLPDGIDRRSSVYKEAVKERGDDAVLTRGEADRIEGMAAAVRANREAMALLSLSGVAEGSIFATDPVTGVAVKCRPDWITYGGAMLDLKTTADASDIGFGKSVANYRYYVQEAYYRDVYQWAFGERCPSCAFLVVESDLPHCCTIITLPTDVVEYGRRVYRADLNRYADCLARDEWPGLPGESHMIDMPGWFMAEMDAVMGDVEVTV